MHKDLKAETTIPPAGNRAAQQRRFNEFRTYYSEIRPHESLGDETPGRGEWERLVPGFSRGACRRGSRTEHGSPAACPWGGVPTAA
jgi:hypothetical protein